MTVTLSKFWVKSRLRHQQLKSLDNGGKPLKQWTYSFKYLSFIVGEI